MKTKRIKPHIGATIDNDVAKWLTEMARRQRLSVSAMLNRILADAMERQPYKAA